MHLYLFLLLALGAKGDYSDQWVVHIEGGVAAAEEVAAAHNMDNLGEVLPGSGIYHLKHRRLAKRSSIPHPSAISQHKAVRGAKQLKELRRTKRDGQGEENVRSKRQAEDKNIRDFCFVSTIPTAEKPSGRCVFPFVYKSVLYQRCTSDHSSNNKQWCATKVSRDGTAVKGEWGDCDFDNIQCRVLTVADPDPTTRPPPSIPVLPVRPHVEGPSNSIEEMLSKLAEKLGASEKPKPVKSKSAAPKLPMGAHRLPPSLDDFLLLLGPRGPVFNPPTRTPIVQDGVEVEEGVPRESMSRFTDKEWPRQWYLNRGGDIDMNVEEAWNMGYSGRGVTVTILDDGVEWNHPDLENNYDKNASYDINGNDRDPYPRYDLFDTNKHGTRCAGQVAAVANNSLCSVGVAYKAGIGGVRMLDGTITDAVEARSLSLNPQHIDIYSASWGPDDDGKTVDGPGPLTRRALEEGTKRGRGGKGSIFVWASGNGGKFHDNCNCDGYATSIFTLSVSSASENGVIPWYSEKCSSTLATTYSSGSSRRGERKVITTDLHGKCTASHTGTSASSPMAAAMVALVLEANPSVTWRDIQHIVVRTAKVANLMAPDWSVNGAGFNVSHAFGFGLMDAGQMVKTALKWNQVPPQGRCKVDWDGSEQRVSPRDEVTLDIDITGCHDTQVLEHVHVVVDMSSRSRRGDFSLLLRSPQGTESVLLAPRPRDNSISGFANFRTWPLMSTHYWGENPRGKWSLVVKNAGTRDARLMGWQIILYGTKTNHNL